MSIFISLRDRTDTFYHLRYVAQSSEHCQRCIKVGHVTGLLPADEWLQHHPSCRTGTRSFIPNPLTTTSWPATSRLLSTALAISFQPNTIRSEERRVGKG